LSAKASAAAMTGARTGAMTARIGVMTAGTDAD
jgi:hypothetical protein